MKKISVIIPLFNNAEHISQAIESILNQTIAHEIECIVVNDGSTDNGGDIADKFKNNGVIVIHTPNMGVSCARNTGLKFATGKWIGFVDSDDYCLPNMYEIMIQKGEENNVDIVQCNHFKDNNGKVYVYEKRKNQNKVMNMRIDGCEIINNYYSSVVMKIFKRELLNKNNITFFEACRVAEDTAFTTLAINYGSIMTIEDALYINRVRANSVSRTKTIYEEMNLLFTMQRLKIELISRNLWDISKPRIERYIKNTINNIDKMLNINSNHMENNLNNLETKVLDIEKKLSEISKILK